jgi:hypothetical protein
VNGGDVTPHDVDEAARAGESLSRLRKVKARSSTLLPRRRCEISSYFRHTIFFIFSPYLAVFKKSVPRTLVYFDVHSLVTPSLQTLKSRTQTCWTYPYCRHTFLCLHFSFQNTVRRYVLLHDVVFVLHNDVTMFFFCFCFLFLLLFRNDDVTMTSQWGALYKNSDERTS